MVKKEGKDQGSSSERLVEKKRMKKDTIRWGLGKSTSQEGIQIISLSQRLKSKGDKHLEDTIDPRGFQ